MIIAVPKEIAAGERRVALVPAACEQLVKQELEVVVEAGAGEGSSFRDQDYEERGVRIEGSPEALLAAADVVLKVREPVQNESLDKHEVDLMKEGATLISFLFPLTQPDLVRRLADRKIAAFAMDLMPRITRAQSMDALSSMSSIAGYRAVLIAATVLPRFFPMLMTAAGTIKPARVLILGAGVAGLQAIATARRLGAVVEAYDIRSVVKEQVESLGARFLELEEQTEDAQDAGGYAKEQTAEAQARQRERMKEHLKRFDVVITTALVPGKKAPVLLTEDMVRAMKHGSVLVDLAAEQGGNCELTSAGETKTVHGVTICGPLNLPSDLAFHASEMYSSNITKYFQQLLKEGKLELDLEDELVRAPLVTRDGEILHEGTRASLEGEETK